MSRNKDDKDLPLHEALLEVMGERSVDSDSQFPLFVFIQRVSLSEGHDELIELIRSRLKYLEGTYAVSTRAAARQAIASLERKKVEHHKYIESKLDALRQSVEKLEAVVRGDAKSAGKVYPDCIRRL